MENKVEVSIGKRQLARLKDDGAVAGLKPAEVWRLLGWKSAIADIIEQTTPRELIQNWTYETKRAAAAAAARYFKEFGRSSPPLTISFKESGKKKQEVFSPEVGPHVPAPSPAGSITGVPAVILNPCVGMHGIPDDEYGPAAYVESPHTWASIAFRALKEQANGRQVCVFTNRTIGSRELLETAALISPRFDDPVKLLENLLAVEFVCVHDMPPAEIAALLLKKAEAQGEDDGFMAIYPATCVGVGSAGDVAKFASAAAYGAEVVLPPLQLKLYPI